MQKKRKATKPKKLRTTKYNTKQSKCKQKYNWSKKTLQHTIKRHEANENKTTQKQHKTTYNKIKRSK